LSVCVIVQLSDAVISALNLSFPLPSFGFSVKNRHADFTAGNRHTTATNSCDISSIQDMQERQFLDTLSTALLSLCIMQSWSVITLSVHHSFVLLNTYTYPEYLHALVTMPTVVSHVPVYHYPWRNTCLCEGYTGFCWKSPNELASAAFIY